MRLMGTSAMSSTSIRIWFTGSSGSSLQLMETNARWRAFRACRNAPPTSRLKDAEESAKDLEVAMRKTAKERYAKLDAVGKAYEQSRKALSAEISRRARCEIRQRGHDLIGKKIITKKAR